MATNLGERIRKEGLGIYYGGVAEHTMGREDALFGVEDGKLLWLCHPRNNISKWGLRYWQLPSEFREGITNPDNSRLFKDREILFFLYYSIDKKRVIKSCQGEEPPINHQIVTGEGSLMSAIYTNFMGETLYVGDSGLIKDVMTQLKGGFLGVSDITSKLVREELAESQIQRYNELIVCDTINIPHYVHHRR